MLRALADAKQQALGRTPLRYQFEVVPHAVEGVPAGVDAVSLVWEKGSKLCYTDAAPVDPATRTATFREVMRQSATLYREGQAFLPKEYSLKLQAVAHPHAAPSRRRTVARVRIDLAPYAGHGVHPEAAALEVATDAPGCTLRLSVRAVWLQHLAAGGGGGGGGGGGAESGGAARTDGSSLHSEVTWDAPGGGGSAGPPPPPSVARTSVSLDGDASDGSSDASAGASGGGGGGGGPGASGYHSDAAFLDVLLGLRAGDGGRQCAPAAGGGKGRGAHARSASMPSVLGGGQEAGRAPGGAGGGGAAVAPAPAAAPAAASPAPARVGSVRTRPPRGGVPSPFGAGGGGGAAGTGRLAAIASADHADEGEPPAAPAVPAPEPTLAGGAPGAAAGAPPPGREASGALPAWLWPQARGAVAGASSEELMRAIAGARDLAALQTLARGLLAERNDYRDAARRAEAEAGAAAAARAGLSERVASLERQVSGLRDDSLVGRLVEAKVGAAQADLEAAQLRGSLTRERERSRALAARLTALQERYDDLANRFAAAATAGAVAATGSFGGVPLAGPAAGGAARGGGAGMAAGAVAPLQKQQAQAAAEAEGGGAQDARRRGGGQGGDQDSSGRSIGARVSMLVSAGLRGVHEPTA